MDLSDYIGRLPEIIKNIHELASNMHNNAEIEDFREDLKLLIEMVIHELEINKQKELKIKLFKGLEILENFDFRNGGLSNSFKFLQDNSFIELLLIKIKL